MALTYDVWFQSGLTDENHYQKGDNVSLVSITNTDQQYYQNGSVILYNVPSSQVVGDSVLIEINDSEQLSGYVSSRTQEIRGGVKSINYQLVGKTYDLWRHHTDDDASYSGTTAYIASSLIASYCTGVSGGGITTTDGVDLTNDIDLTNMPIGDAIVRLSKLDGYKFYVDNAGDLQYFFPGEGIYDFTVEESDIVDMTPIEESDGDLVNDVLVLGGTDYSEKTIVSSTHPHKTHFPSGVLVAQRFESSDPTLSAIKVYLGRSIDPNQPDALSFEIWDNTEQTLYDDNFTSYTYISYSSNMQASGSNLCLTETQGTYATIGTVSSTSYSEETQYMKLDLDGVISSSRIYISGTNDGGTTWKTLSDNAWVDFGSESSAGTQIKYKFSSNGTYTPKIDSAILVISDDSGGFDEVLFTDTFGSDINLSSSSSVSSQVISGYLEISGIATTGAHVTPSSRSNESTNGSWHNTAKFIDNDWDAPAYITRSGYTGADSVDIFTLSSPIDLYGVRIKMGAYQSNAGSSVKDIWISSSYTDGWLKVRDTSVAMGGTSPVTKVITFEDTYKYYKDVKKIKVANYYYNIATLTGYFYEIAAIPFTALTVSGSIKTSSQTSLLDSYQLKADLVGYNLDRVTLSGTCDNGAHWTSMSEGIVTDISDYGKNVMLWYFINPWHQSGTKYLNTPRIDSCTLTSYGIQGGGLPKSGSKVEWSDDISFVSGDVPYPSSYSSWQSYTSPKLSGLTTGDNYWMVFEHPSSNSEWWEYYYDSSSSYSGRLCYSWDDGVNWSSNSTNPTDVPDGSMTFQLGWTEGDIKASASNQTSIDVYGRHFKKISDSSYTTLEQTQARADYEVSGMDTIPMKGTLTIDGREDMSTEYRFSSNLTNFAIDEIWNIKSYTQTIDKRGFTTLINYGKHKFDIAQKIAALEIEVNS